MREVKFRAWIHKLNCWADEVVVSCIANVWGYIGFDSNGIPYYNCDLEQYTGLTDKNGKEIYEGDIIISKNIVKKGAEVKWDVYGWSIGSCWPFSDYESSYGSFDFEVIGNIHENPELLKGDVN
jgi:hypothetical protein